MRSKLLGLFVAGALVFGGAVANAADFNNHVGIGILSLFVGNFNVRYERNVNDFISIAGGVGFSPSGYIFVGFEEDDLDWTYYNVNGVVRLYPLGTFRSLYIQAEVNGDIHKLKDKSTGETGTITMITPAAVVGWRWVIAERATITLGAGSGYASADIEVGDESVKFEGIRPRVDLNLGFLF